MDSCSEDASAWEGPEYQSQCALMAQSPSPQPDYCIRNNRYNYAAKIPRPPAELTPESSLYRDIPDYLSGPERLINNERFITQTGSVHNRKLYEEGRDWMPNHPQAPSHDRVKFIRPDYHLKIQGVNRANMKPYDPKPFQISESKAEFKAKWPEPSMYGQAAVFTTDHFVHMPENRKNVIETFSYDDMFSVMRKAHPYLSTYRLYHKNFKDDLDKYKALDSSYNAKDTDCAIKLRSRPMLDPFEQSLDRENTLANSDMKQLLPHDPKNFSHLKLFFRRPPYAGCYPRVHQPVPHVGWGTSYTDHYDKPLHPNMALNFHNDFKFCYIQPKASSLSVAQTPAMYVTENNIYGSGRCASKYVDSYAKDRIGSLQKSRDDERVRATIRDASFCSNNGCTEGASKLTYCPTKGGDRVCCS